MVSSNLIRRASAFAILGCFAFCAPTASQAKVLAKVDGTEITDQDVAAAATDLGPTIPDQLQGDQRQKYILTYLIDLDLVAKKAASEKLDENPDYARQMAYYREKVLMEALLGKAAQAAVTDAAVQKAYDDAAKAQKPEIEIHARHILVQTKEEAEAALKRIKGGEDFGKVANEISKDPTNNGGDLGWFTKDKMVPEFADAAFKMKPGQISDPIQTQFGWHIIQVEGERQKQFPPLAQVKPDVERYLQQKAQGDLIMQLRQTAKIERFDAAPAAAPAPAPAEASPGATSPTAPTSDAPKKPSPSAAVKPEGAK